MNRNRSLLALVLAAAMVQPRLTDAHQTPVHEAITAAAYVRAKNVAEFNMDHGQHMAFPPAVGRTLQGYLGYVANRRALGLPLDPHDVVDPPKAADLSPWDERVLGKQLTPGYLAVLGSLLEDNEPLYCNHFYDVTPGAPTHALHDDVGVPHFCGDHLEDSAEFLGESYERNPYSWPVALDCFNRGFATADPESRARALAKGYVALGGVLHLIEDASQPSHVRNDAHGGAWDLHTQSWDALKSSVLKGIAAELGYYSALEIWETRADGFAFAAQATKRASASIPMAMKPVDALVSLAHYTGNNFFSDHTILMAPCPRVATEDRPTGKFVVDAHLPGRPPLALAYHRIVLDGPPPPDLSYTLFQKDVLKAQLQELMPRAVTASAAALNYFFRVRLQMACAARLDATGPTLVISLKNVSHALAASRSTTQVTSEGRNAVDLANPGVDGWTVLSETAGGTRTPIAGITVAGSPSGLLPGEFLTMTAPVTRSQLAGIVAIYAVYHGSTRDGERAFACAEQVVHLTVPPPTTVVVANNVQLGSGYPLSVGFDASCHTGDVLEVSYANHTDPGETDTSLHVSVAIAGFHDDDPGNVSHPVQRFPIGGAGNYRVTANLTGADDAQDYAHLTVRIIPNPN
jgi:hypothetical protein